MAPIETQRSEELYLLVPGTVNVKVRNDLVNIKVLEQVGAEGLERWIPVVKAEFPVTGSDLTKLVSALGLATRRLDRDEFSLDQLITELVESAPETRTVKVGKHRVRYRVGGCTAELTDLLVDGRAARTVAVESEDPAAVLTAVRDLGLDGYTNVNYSRGLAHILSEEPDRYAVIDVGTNSVKFHVGERDADGSWRTVVDRAEVTRLGEDLDKHGVIVPRALERTAAAIAEMVDEARNLGALAVAAVGTAGLRIARNAVDVVDTIRAASGITVEVITGEEEARLAYLAAQASLGLGEGSVAVFDTGGGSTQFTFGRGAHVEERFSVEVGAVRYTERFELDKTVSSATLRIALDAISEDLSSIDDRQAPDALVGMGGAITNITAVSHSLARYDPDVVQGTVLDRDEIDRQIEMYRSTDAEERRSIVGLQPKRADVILAGACIVRTVMEILSQETLTVSDRGLRHGLMRERFGASPTG